MMKVLVQAVSAFLTFYLTSAQSGVPQCILKIEGMTLIGGCVPPDRCNVATNTIYNDGTGIINTRLGLDEPIGCEAHQVCCSIAGSSGAVTPPTDPPGPTTQRCGIPKPQTIPGFTKTKLNEADPGEFPWAVFILATTNVTRRYKYTSTGSLIHDRVVLTAAHLLDDKEARRLRVIVGAHHQLRHILPRNVAEVDEIIIHPNYNFSNGDNNFALLFLKSSATSGLPQAGTICLPPANYAAPAGTRCVFAGWGHDANEKTQDLLTKVEAPFVPHSACQDRLRLSPKHGPGFELMPTFFCVGGEVGKDLCGGAGGSPLACPIENQSGRFIQTGLETWVTEGCGVDGVPIVFANVAAARSWIDQEMASHQYTTESYTY